MYCLNLLRISLELRSTTKFTKTSQRNFSSTSDIAAAINGVSDGHGAMPMRASALGRRMNFITRTLSAGRKKIRSRCVPCRLVRCSP